MKELPIHTITWISPKYIWLRDWSYGQKAIYCIILFIKHERKIKAKRMEYPSVLSSCWGESVLVNTQETHRRILRIIKLFCMVPEWWIHDIMHLSKHIELSIQFTENELSVCKLKKINQDVKESRMECRLWQISLTGLHNCSGCGYKVDLTLQNCVLSGSYEGKDKRSIYKTVL